jgi:hypothetical protein
VQSRLRQGHQYDLHVQTTMQRMVKTLTAVNGSLGSPADEQSWVDMFLISWAGLSLRRHSQFGEVQKKALSPCDLAGLDGEVLYVPCV